jgi:CBS domain-containing protein
MDIMTPAKTLSPKDSVQAAAQQMAVMDVGTIPIVENDAPVGIISDRDIVLRVVAQGHDPKQKRIEEIMTRDVHSVGEKDDVKEAVRKMEDKQIRRVMVVNNQGRLTGIVSLGDLALADDTRNMTAEVLEHVSRPQMAP